METQPTKKTFVRWGDIPPDERSRRYDRKNAGRHQGTSCYEATQENGKWRIKDRNLTLNGFETIAGFLYDKTPRPIFLISGRIVGNGPDNEPLIREITITKTLQVEELHIPHLHEPAEQKILKERREIKTWGCKL